MNGCVPEGWDWFRVRASGVDGGTEVVRCNCGLDLASLGCSCLVEECIRWTVVRASARVSRSKRVPATLPPPHSRQRAHATLRYKLSGLALCTEIFLVIPSFMTMYAMHVGLTSASSDRLDGSVPGSVDSVN